MIFTRMLRYLKQPAHAAALACAAMILTACMATDTDDTTGSRLAQPPAGGQIRKPIDADDIAIVGQEVAHSIMDLPAIQNAATPPLAQFTGVTSIVKGPIPVDTDPYTELLRDRLLLLTREKLRFEERTLPPLVLNKKGKSKKKAAPAPATDTSSAVDYQILAELRGNYEDDLYKIQIQFVDTRTGEVLFDGLYRIRKEASGQPGDNSAPGTTPQDSPPSADPTTAPAAATGSPSFQ